MSGAVFIDTSAIYALADRSDANHKRAVEILEAIAERGDALVTHGYILVESVALIQRRLGSAVAIEFLENALSVFEIVWIESSVHMLALEHLKTSPRRHLSFVDRVSFVVMKDKGIGSAFAFDDGFRREGFATL
jgi:predicted nucleic acid-binding protein